MHKSRFRKCTMNKQLRIYTLFCLVSFTFPQTIKVAFQLSKISYFSGNQNVYSFVGALSQALHELENSTDPSSDLYGYKYE